MAGEKLIRMINARGGSDTEYSDVVFGIVVDTSPLSIKLSEKIILSEPFLIVSRYLSDYKQKIALDGKNQEITVFNALAVGDRVAMIRLDGGQQFYVLEKLGG